MRFLLASAAALTLAAAPASAQLDLTWKACATAGGDSTITFACSDPDSVASLFGVFTPPESVERFVALSVIIEVQSRGDSLAPFWHYQAGGCNSGGVTFTDAMPATGCGGARNPWGEEGRASIGALAAYLPNVEARGRARMACVVALPADQPITLEAGVPYFGFLMRFFTHAAREAGGKCDGCREPMVLSWTTASLARVAERPGDPAPPEILLTGPGRIGSCARVNGGLAATCASIPPPRRTWDMLKGIRK